MKQINTHQREIKTLRNQNKVYKEFSDGKVSKIDLKTIIDQSEKQENEFAQIKLRKVKVERIKVESKQEQDFDNNEPKSIKQLMSMFNKPKDDKPKDEYITKKTVLEAGNIGASGVFRPKKKKVDESGIEILDEQGNAITDSSDEEEVQEDKIEEEKSTIETSAPEMSFI